MPTQTTDLELRIKAATEGLASVEKLSDEIDALGGDSKALRDEASKLNADLQSLGRQQAVIDNFNATSAAADKAAAELAELRAKAAAATETQSSLSGNLDVLRGSLDQTRTHTEELRSQLQQSGVVVEELTARFGKNSQFVSQAKDAYNETKKALKDSESAQKDLEKAVRADETALAKQEATLGKLNPQIEKSEQSVRDQADALTQAGKAADYAGINTSDLATEQQRVTRETANAKSAAADLSGRLQDERAALTEAKSAADKTADSSKKLGDEQQKAGEKAKDFNANFKTVIASLAAFAGIQLGGQLVKDLIGLADEAKNIDARLKIAAGSSEAFAQAQKDVLAIALQTGTKLESAANLYGRLAIAIKSTGGNAADAAIATRAISESFAVSGASADSANAAIVQLAQGLASGTLRGDELNSVLEQAPRLAQAFADSLGITTGELRALGTEGKLTPQILLDALKQQAPKIAEEFNQIPITVGRAITNLGTQLTVAVGHIDATTNSTTALADALNDLGPKIEPTLRVLGGSIEVVFGGIRSSFNLLQIALGELEAAFFDVFGDIALAASKLTFGDISRNFAEVGKALKGTSAEIEARMSQDLDDIRASGDLVTQGAKLLAQGFADTGDAAAASATGTAAAGDAAEKTGNQTAGAADKIKLAGGKFIDVAAQMAKAAEVLHTDVGLLTDGISADAQKAADALGMLLQSGQVTADGIRVATQQAIDAAKTVQDLDLIRGAIEKAYAAGAISIDDMRTSVDAVTTAQQKLEVTGGIVAQQLGAAAESLGLNYDRVAQRASDSAKTAIKAFDDLAASGTVSIGGLGGAIDGVFSKLQSKADIEAFRTSLTDAMHAGQISGEQYGDALKRCDELLIKLRDEADPLAAKHKAGLAQLAAAYDERIQREKDAATASRQATAEQIGEYEKLRGQIGSAGLVGDLQLLRQSLNDAFAAGTLSAEQYSALVDEIKSKTTELQEGLRGVEGFAETIGKYYAGLYADLNQLSAAAAAKFQSLELGKPFREPMDDVATLRAQINALSAEIQSNQRYLQTWATAGLGELMTKSAIHFDQVKKEFTEQQLAALQFQQQLADTNDVTVGLIDQAQRAVQGFDLLGDQQLSGLRSAIDSARQKLDSLRDSATSTLSSLNEELAEAQGNLVQAQQLRNAQRVADLQAQLAQAQALGDQQSVATLQQALKTLQQINAINLDNAKQQQTQQQQPLSTPITPSTSSGAAKKVEVTLNIGGQRVTGAFDESDADALIAALEHAQSISTH